MRTLAVATAMMVAAMAPSAPLHAQPSFTCEFAISAWAAARLALSEARSEHSACLRERSSACTAQQGRVQTLEQQLRLLRNYLDGYCRR